MEVGGKVGGELVERVLGEPGGDELFLALVVAGKEVDHVGRVLALGKDRLWKAGAPGSGGVETADGDLFKAMTSECGCGVFKGEVAGFVALEDLWEGGHGGCAGGRGGGLEFDEDLVGGFALKVWDGAIGGGVADRKQEEGALVGGAVQDLA